MHEQDIGSPEGLPLSAAALRLYEAAAARGSVSTAEAAAAASLPPAEATEAVATLRQLGLLGTDPHDARRHVAIAPDSARVHLVGPLTRDIALTQQRIDLIQSGLSALTPLYQAGADQRLSRHGVEAIGDLDVVRRLLTEFAASAGEEVLTSQPGGARPDEVLAEAMPRTEELLCRGVTLRTIYQHTAQFSRATTAYVEHVTARGAEVRTTVTGFARMLVFDGKVAVLPLQGPGRGAVVVRDPSIVAFAADAFERSWNAATPFPLQYSRDQAIAASGEVRRTIAELLTQGVSDRRVAEQVGLSLRTCQRHIAEIMQELGARNRLHAGYLLHRQRVSTAADATTQEATTQEGRPGAVS